MEERRYRVRLLDMIACIGQLRIATAGVDFQTLQHDWTLQRAVERAIEILSEASRHIPEHLSDRHPHIPWRDIKAIGNFLRHEYEKIDLDLLWKIVTDDLDLLEEALRDMVKQA